MYTRDSQSIHKASDVNVFGSTPFHKNHKKGKACL